MGVYIKGMKMPESCILCRLECLYRIHSSSVRSKYCPLIEIAEPKDEPQTNYVLSKDSEAYKINKRMEVEEEWLNEQSGKE